ncbi:MAG: hypothetical protein KGJ48_09115 [Nitrospirota bacterium]|nr:hypothetical protein [Nitrospirota bacterium]MDE3217988.1 hypothetical protein [Nitrospirota bacterium]
MGQRSTSFARLTLAGVLCSLAVTGCLSPITLNRAVTAYDEAVTNAISKQLLINIARAHQHQPIHFTGVSNIAATFDFHVSAGATPALTGEASRGLMPIFGGSVAENPTISIVPIEGEEFTKRLLTPFQETKFLLLLRQRFDIDLMLRLMAQELRITENGEEIAYRNTPADRTGYEMFRRVVTHISAIQDANQLYAEPLVYNRTWTIPANSVTAEGFQALQKEYLVTYSQKDNSYTLRKQITGRIVITNYDPDILSPEERARLIDNTEEGQLNDVSFDIRPGHVGGEYPLKGDFRLRSFNTILNFLGRSLGEDPEYDVESDPRTPAFYENPVHTMELLLSDEAPSGADLSIRSHGKYYAVNSNGPMARWNREAFQLLYLLFQMTVTEVPRVGVPSITIAK